VRGCEKEGEKSDGGREDGREGENRAIMLTQYTKKNNEGQKKDRATAERWQQDEMRNCRREESNNRATETLHLNNLNLQKSVRGESSRATDTLFYNNLNLFKV
jgi:hypothetical protein